MTTNLNIRYYKSLLETIKKIYLRVKKAHVYWYYIANLIALAVIVALLYSSFSMEAELRNINREIKEEKLLISRIEQLYNKNINKWNSLTSPSSLELLAEKHLSDFEPIFQENSISELPQNK